MSITDEKAEEIRQSASEAMINTLDRLIFESLVGMSVEEYAKKTEVTDDV